MAFDVYHQALQAISEACDGNPGQLVSVVDVLKRLRLLGNREMILSHLLHEGWVADAPKTDHVFLTSWGIEELEKARRKGPGGPSSAEKAREAARLGRELVGLLEEWTEKGPAKALSEKTKKALAALTEAVTDLDA